MAVPVVEAITKLYVTIFTMADKSLDGILFAPPEGHTLPPGAEEELSMHKTDTVVQLIKKLPYVDYQHLAPASEAINYVDVNTSIYQPYYAWRPIKWGIDEVLVLPHELPLTLQEDGCGDVLVIDTDTWEARVYDSEWPHGKCAVHRGGDDKCPILCRSQERIRVEPAVEVLTDWTRNYETLEWMVKQDDSDILGIGLGEEYFEVSGIAVTSH